jgi:S1-C subfamily serine protease
MRYLSGGAQRDAGARQRWQGPVAGLLIIVLMMITSLVAVGCTYEWGGKADTTVSSVTGSGQTGSATGSGTTTPSVNVVTSGEGLASPAQSVASVLGPSVVNIGSSGTQTGPGGPGFQEFKYAYEGSGVIYSVDGMIITNNHVVTDDNGDRVDKLEVTLATGERLPATIVGTDPMTDLAIVKVDAGFELPAATFVTETPEVGEYAVAIGSPLGYQNSVSLGIVSGVGRSIEEAQGLDGVALNNLLQTDAPISPGNSGGALANASGQVIGINVAYEPPTTGAVSIGFAIPSVVVTKVADEIISTGKATHAYLGVSTRTVTPDLQEQFALSRATGILVAQVILNGPAAKAGIQRGDIITKIDDTEMVDSSDLLMAIRDKKPGDTVGSDDRSERHDLGDHGDSGGAAGERPVMSRAARTEPRHASGRADQAVRWRFASPND